MGNARNAHRRMGAIWDDGWDGYGFFSFVTPVPKENRVLPSGHRGF